MAREIPRQQQENFQSTEAADFPQTTEVEKYLARCAADEESEAGIDEKYGAFEVKRAFNPLIGEVGLVRVFNGQALRGWPFVMGRAPSDPNKLVNIPWEDNQKETGAQAPGRN